MMKKKYIAMVLAAACWGMSSCNDSFLDEEPKTDLTENNAFNSYDNFKMFAWPCYTMFKNGTIATSLASIMQSGPYRGDLHAGYFNYKWASSSNSWAYQKISSVAKGNGWNFDYIKRVNMMLEHIDGSQMTEAEKNHWRAVGYFFHSYWYAELIDRFGDVPWVDKVLKDDSPEAYGERMPRKEVADKVLGRLMWAKDHVGDFKARDGKNTVNREVIEAFVSRFALREGTWRKFHELGDWQKYLETCAEISAGLMKKYPTLYRGTDGQPAAGYGEMWTTDDLEGVPGVIFYQSNVLNVNAGTWSMFEHTSSHGVEMNSHTLSLYLMKNGRPIEHAESGYAGNGSIYKEFRNRDPRLYHVVMPPYRVKAGKGDYPTWSYTEDEADREYIDIMGPNEACANPGVGMKRLPAQNWGALLAPECPRLGGYVSSRSGYYVWKNYTCWEKNMNAGISLNVADKPIFKIEEVLLNRAEAMYELGRFDQGVADETINRLRDRAGVAPMVVDEVDEAFDPQRAKYYPKGNVQGVLLEPLQWEIRRERIVELMGEGFGFYDIRRWRMAPWFLNRAPTGVWCTKEYAKRNRQTLYNPTTGLSDGNNGTMTEGRIFLFNDPLKEGKGWLEKYYLYQVPTTEIVLNPKLTQNPGY